MHVDLRRPTHLFNNFLPVIVTDERQCLMDGFTFRQLYCVELGWVEAHYFTVYPA